MTNDITLAKRPQLTLDVIQTAKLGGQIIYESRMFGASTPEAATAIMITAYELGLQMTAGFDLMHYINGRVTLSPRGALALVHASGQLAAMNYDESPDQCAVTMARRNGLSYTSTYTMDDAKRAGLVKDGSAWAKYPRNMLRWRATGECINILFPDVIAGLYTADAFGAAVDDDGNVIDSGFVDADS